MDGFLPYVLLDWPDGGKLGAADGEFVGVIVGFWPNHHNIYHNAAENSKWTFWSCPYLQQVARQLQRTRPDIEWHNET